NLGLRLGRLTFKLPHLRQACQSQGLTVAAAELLASLKCFAVSVFRVIEAPHKEKDIAQAYVGEGDSILIADLTIGGQRIFVAGLRPPCVAQEKINISQIVVFRTETNLVPGCFVNSK